MSGPFSPTSPTPLAFYDPESWSWRTSQGCLLSAAPESLERLPAWGTTSDGALYEHRTPERLTAARDGSALLGTPTQMDAHGGQRSAEFRRGRTHTPVELAALLQTPTAWLGRRPSQAIGDPERWHNPERSNELSDQIAALLPTPVVNDMGANKTVEWWDAWAPNQKAADGRPAPHGKNLSIEVQRLLPTPTVQDGANNAGPSQWNRNSDPLNVVAVKLSGGTTPRPLSDGSESSDGQHPNPPTTGNCPAGSSSG